MLQDQNPDLFYSVPWSYGTLGFLVAAELKIIPSRKYVKLEYTPLTTRQEINEKFKAASLSEERYDFVETLVYERDGGVLMTGRLTDDYEVGKVFKTALGSNETPTTYAFVDDNCEGCMFECFYGRYEGLFMSTCPVLQYTTGVIGDDLWTVPTALCIANCKFAI